MDVAFDWLDYIVFGLLLLVSASIGVYHGCSGGKQKTVKEWLAGNQSLSWLPTSLSLMATLVSAITLLGTPATLYTDGVNYLYVCLSLLIVMPLTAFIYMPVFRRVNSLSAFVYLERRFGKLIAQFNCIVYICHAIVYMGIVLYAPALALSAVTGLSLEGSIVTLSIICLFYTVIGGMKAIIWTDALQVSVMILGMIVVAVVGTYKVGGLAMVFEVSEKGKHLDFTDFSFDPTKQLSGFDCIFGGIFTLLTIYATNQASMQRFICVGSKVDARKTILLNLPGFIFFVLISGYMGLLAYTKYALCDPIETGRISKPDQILPYFVADTFKNWFGFSGLFVASIFSGSLSTISSGVNALAAVVLTNLIPTKTLSDTSRTKAGKILATLFGLLSLCFAFICKYLPAILPLALSLHGLLNGPLLAIFTLGMLSPKTNNVGANVGFFFGLFFQIFIYAGSLLETYTGETITLFATNCSQNLDPTAKLNQLEWNQKVYGAHTLPTDTLNSGPLSKTIFRVSYLWYALIGFTVTTIVSYIVSLINRCFLPDTDDVDEDLLFHLEDLKSSDYKPYDNDLEEIRRLREYCESDSD